MDRKDIGGHRAEERSLQEPQWSPVDAFERVLIVNGSAPFRTMVARMLSDLGYETLEAANGTEALAQLDQIADIGLILLDWNIPTMNGVELLERLKSEKEKYANPIVVMVSTENNRGQIAKAMQLGAREYIMKPFTKEILEEKLALLGLKGKDNG